MALAEEDGCASDGRVLRENILENSILGLFIRQMLLGEAPSNEVLHVEVLEFHRVYDAPLPALPVLAFNLT